MNWREHAIFAATYAAAFARYAIDPAVSDSSTDATDDEAAIVAGNVARRAVNAWRRLMKAVP